MTTTNSTEVIQAIIKQLRLLPALESVPIGVANQIVPVMIAIQARPKEIIARDASRGSGGTTTMFTTAKDKDFYLTSVSCGICEPKFFDGEGARSDCGSARVAATVNGTARTIIKVFGAFSELDGSTGHLALMFDPPILISKDTNIQLISIHGSTPTDTTATMTGYEEETTW